MRTPLFVRATVCAWLSVTWAAQAAAQAPQCTPAAASVAEDSTLSISLTCVEGGHLRGLGLDHVRSVAGTGVAGSTGDGGPATVATLNFPHGVAVDPSGTLYISESGSHQVRRVDGATGIITLIAGSGSAGFAGDEGPASVALLNDPRSVAVDALGNVFIADVANARIRRVDAATGIISTVVGGGSAGLAEDLAATEAALISVGGIAFDGGGDLFLVEVGRSRIRRVFSGPDGLITGAPDEIITTVAGTGVPGFSGDGGPATLAQFSLEDLAFDSDGNLFVADRQNHRIRRVVPGLDGRIQGAEDEIVTTVAGGGATNADSIPATLATLNLPRGVAVDRFGNVFISEAGALRVRRVDGTSGNITTVVGGSALGEDIPAATARTFNPRNLDTDLEGNLFIAELGGHRIRAVRLHGAVVSYELASAPAHGLATLSPDGVLSYAPDPDFAGADQLTFRALNGANQPGDAATVAIDVAPVDDPPVADAGPDRTVDAAVAVRLDGSRSFDPDGTPITHLWTFTVRPGGSSAVLHDASTAAASFVPDQSGTYVVELMVADSLGASATDSVTVSAALPVTRTGIQVVLEYQPQGGTAGPPSATGAAYWIEGQVGTVTLGRMADGSGILYGLASSAAVGLWYGPGSLGRNGYALPVGVERVQTGALTTLRVNLSSALGEVEGSVLSNGAAPGPGLALCVRSTEGVSANRPYGLWCMDLPAKGVFDLLLPAGAGHGSICRMDVVAEFGDCEAVVGGRQGQAPRPLVPLAAFDFVVEQATVTSVAPIGVAASAIQVVLQYEPQGGSVGPPSATGAQYWIEGQVGGVTLGRMGDGTDVLYGLAANARVSLWYGPNSLGQIARALTVGTETVHTGALTTLRVDLSDALGEIEGSVRLNGATPGPGLALCVRSTEGVSANRPYGLWCMDLPATGAFDLLLPAGAGHGSICRMDVVAEFGDCEAVVGGRQGQAPRPLVPLAAFDFVVEQATVTSVAPIGIAASAIQVVLQYEPRGGSVGPPSATGAQYWIEGQVGGVTLGRMGDGTDVLYGLAANARVSLWYGPNSLGQIARALTVGTETVHTGALTTLRVDLSDALGEIEGSVRLNGAAPGPGLALCVRSTEGVSANRPYGLWCMDLPATGVFDLLLPAGAGHGSVCRMDVVAEFGHCEAAVGGRRGQPPRVLRPLAAFDFTVEPGTVSGVVPR